MNQVMSQSSTVRPAKRGVLLINLGSPDSPSVPDVRRYLREFLMDGRVMDVPYPLRFAIVHGMVLPFRPHASAEAYQKVWTEEGSPLISTSRRLGKLLAEQTGVVVELAMRYQNPSVSDALWSLWSQAIEDVLVIPLFPHYAMSSYESAVEEVKRIARKQFPSFRLEIMNPYFSQPEYINALVDVAEPYLSNGYDHLLFSFHGVPERHIRKADPTESHCLKSGTCCETPSPAHATCYRQQCFSTVKHFVAATRRTQTPVAEDRYSIAFQSRLGRAKWLLPSAHDEMIRLAKGGVKRLAVMCPAFTVDCLETIEEIGIRGRAAFMEAGGEELMLVPCLNDHPRWIEALGRMVTDYQPATEAHAHKERPEHVAERRQAEELVTIAAASRLGVAG